MSGFLRLEGVSKRFGEHAVLESISLDVEQGEFLTLLGESGSGKTTLLRILAGFEQPTTGCDAAASPPDPYGLSELCSFSSHDRL